MCYNKGYYSANRRVAEKVAYDLIERNNADLIAYYLTIAYEDDQHTYMNDLAWAWSRATDEEKPELEKHIREMIDIDDEDIHQFEDIFREERPEVFANDEDF
tara:strand:+ start:349 stop:654 length:306 start_codon:yes stop_codon:yes gene_type:complete